MSDRDAILKIGVDASEMGPAAKEAKALGTEIKKIGDAGGDAAGDLNRAADAVEGLETAEVAATQASRDTVNALEGVGHAALESSQDAVSGASGAARALDGVTAAAGEESAALLATGAAAQESGAEARTALDQVTAAEERAASGARELGQATEQAADEAEGFKEGVRQVEKLADSIRESGMALNEQQRAISEALGEIEKLIAAENAAGRTGQETANLAGVAAETFRRKLAEVNAEIEREKEALQRLGDEGPDAFGLIGDAAFNVDATTTAAAKHIENAWEALNDNFAVTPRQLSLISQAVAATEIAIVRAGERGQAVTIDQLALYERQKASLSELTAIANKLTNASKDNAIGLKQTGAQLAGVTNGVQQLTSMLGPHASKIGMVVGNVGQLGSVMESLQAQVKSLDLNTVSLTGSATKLGIQVAAMVAVFAAAATAGVKLAETNSQNAESVDDLWEAMKRLASGEIDKVKGQIGGLQTGLQDLLIASNAKEFAHALAEIAIASGRGANGVKLYNVALRDGLTAQQAMRVAASATAETLKFYEDSTKGGAEGHKLWTEALRVSKGDVAALRAFIASHNAEMARSVQVTAAQTEAQKANNEVMREAGSIVRSGEVDLLAMAAANDQITQAQNGSTAAMNEGLEAIRQMIAASDLNNVELGEKAALLETVLAKVDNLSGAERARIQTVIDLAQRGGELTESERAYGAALAESIINGNKAIASMVTRTETAGVLKTAIDDLVTATAAESSALDTNETAIQKAVASAEKLLASNESLDVIERLRLSTIVELGKEVGELAAQQDRLTAATVTTLEAENASGVAESGLILVKSGKVDMIQREIDIRAELIAKLASEKTNTNALTVATQEIIKVQQDGRTVYTNLSEEQRKSADATRAVGDAAETASGQTGILIQRLSDGTISITNAGTAAANTATSVDGLGNAASEAAPKIEDAWVRIAAGVGSLDATLERMRELERLFASVTTLAPQMAGAVEASSARVSKASGFARGKVQEVG